MNFCVVDTTFCMLNIAVFASGKGSNFKAILDAIDRGRIRNVCIVVVVSNNSDAGALAIGRDHKIPALHISREQFGSDELYTNALQTILSDHKVNFIVLAGYMKKIDPSIVKTFKHNIVNIHPALLPKFGGKGMFGIYVHRAVIAAKEKQSGATVHLVDEEYDRGPIVLQKHIDVAENDTPESLAVKVLEIEHELYPEAIRLFAEGTVRIDNHNRVTLSR
jgi:phosphoribosylglycinamide formyltransferase-1